MNDSAAAYLGLLVHAADHFRDEEANASNDIEAGHFASLAQAVEWTRTAVVSLTVECERLRGKRDAAEDAVRQMQDRLQLYEMKIRGLTGEDTP